VSFSVFIVPIRDWNQRNHTTSRNHTCLFLSSL